MAASENAGASGRPALTGGQAGRWETVLSTLVGLLPAGGVRVLVDGVEKEGLTGVVADGLADRLRQAGRGCHRLAGDERAGAGPAALIVDAAASAGDPAAGWDVVIRLRSRYVRRAHDGRPADIVVDVDDPGWPVIRRVAAGLVGDGRWHVPESQAFFGVRAAGWDTKFGDDLPAYAAAVHELGVRPGAVVLDAGCGTGRALPALRDAVGPGGRVLALDVTPEMLAVTRQAGRADAASLVLADARRLPLADQSLDAVFAAGLVHHLPDMAAGVAELARVSRPGARLAIFHPSGRAALAARHGRTLRPEEPLAAARLGPLLAAGGWRLDGYDDPPHRFLALATRGHRPAGEA
jgi:SAM-dependent methyltransferase